MAEQVIVCLDVLEQSLKNLGAGALALGPLFSALPGSVHCLNCFHFVCCGESRGVAWAFSEGRSSDVLSFAAFGVSASGSVSAVGGASAER